MSAPAGELVPDRASQRHGLLSAAQRADTLVTIAEAQLPNGFIPRVAGRGGDPWNHVEAAMALASGGFLAEADRAFHWCTSAQAADGSWPAEIGPGGEATTARIDTNCVAYIAVGAWHRYLASGDEPAAAALLPAVDRALALVLSCQRPGGEVCWEIDAGGRLGRYALLTASCSIHQALLAGAALAALAGSERPGLLAAATRLRRAIAEHLAGSYRGAFEPKDEFAMDWYYPVLGGVLSGDAAAARLAAGRLRFVVDGLGVRCRSDGHWVTTAETAECALAYGRCGDLEQAASLLGATRHQRQADGSYATGLVHPGRNEFPPGERTTYSAAAVLLAEEALGGGVAASTFGWLDDAAPNPGPVATG